MPSRCPNVTRRSASLMLTGLAFAASHATGRSRDRLDDADRQFIEEAAHAGMAGVELGGLATERASATQVRVFADTVVRERSESNAELAAMARAKGVLLPDSTERLHRHDGDRLARLSGAEFDKAYMKHATADHRKTLSLFERAADTAKDSELRAFARRTIPTLQTHLAAAENIESTISAT
jgi:putative membrane protein